MRRSLLFLMLITLTAGCSNFPQYKGFIVDEVSFVNQTSMAVHDVAVTVEQTGGVVSCGYIPVSGDCTVGFPVRQYHGQPVKVSWQQAGKNWDTGEFIILPEKIKNPNQPVSVKVLLNPNGDYAVHVRQ
jgi:hypothetical protein